MWPALKMFCRLKVSGKEHLKGHRQVIFAVNHASELDPLVVQAALGSMSRYSPLFFVSGPIWWFKDKLFKWRRYIYTKTFFKMLGAYPVVAGQHDYAASLVDHVAILKQGYSMVIFPEGGLTKDGNIGEARGGVVYLGEATNIAIVPVAISGTFQLNPRSFFSRSRPISIEFGAPQYASDLLTAQVISHQENPYKAAARTIMNTISVMKQCKIGLQESSFTRSECAFA
jgi:1-acyl-sn-glycerol-3-phosphate acyltransferase